MSVFLRVLSPAGTKDVAVLQQGAPLRIGRGEHNDVSFAEDHLMSFEHCLLQLQDASTCELTDLQSTNGTFVDGQPVETAMLDMVSLCLRRDGILSGVIVVAGHH